MDETTTARDGRPAHSNSAGFREAARSRGAAMVRRLRHYVEHETPTGDAPALDELARELVAVYEELGARVGREHTPTGDHVVAEVPGRGTGAAHAPILLIGHHDTVWPAGRLASMPWRVETSAPAGNAAASSGAELAYGPGAYDMKGGLVVMETALALLHESGADHRPLRIVVVSDEEIGSPTSTDLVTRCAEGAGAALGFESPHADGALKFGRRGSTRLRVSVRGRAAHAALDPERGISAIDELLDQLVAARSLVAGHPGDVLCNVGTIEGGGKTNVVPDTATADLGLRFTSADVEREILNHLTVPRPVREGAGVETEILSHRPTWVASEASHALLADVRAAADSVGQGVPAAPAAGAADTNTVGSLGVPTLDGLGPRGAGAHADHEHVVLASLPERAALVAAVLARL